MKKPRKTFNKLPIPEVLEAGKQSLKTCLERNTREAEARRKKSGKSVLDRTFKSELSVSGKYNES